MELSTSGTTGIYRLDKKHIKVESELFASMAKHSSLVDLTERSEAGVLLVALLLEALTLIVDLMLVLLIAWMERYCAETEAEDSPFAELPASRMLLPRAMLLERPGASTTMRHLAMLLQLVMITRCTSTILRLSSALIVESFPMRRTLSRMESLLSPMPGSCTLTLSMPELYALLVTNSA